MNRLNLRIPQIILVIFLFWIFCSLSLLARFSSVVEADGGLISDRPCSAPCFYGIQLENTKFDDVRKILSASDINLFCTEVEIEGSNFINCGHYPFVHAVSIGESREGIVNYIDFRIESDVTVREVIHKFGDPDFVFSSEYPHMRQIYFIQESITLRFYVRGNDEDYSITENTLVDQVYYYKFPKDNSRLVEWQGYGFYPPNE